jgi:HEAT repeat protein
MMSRWSVGLAFLFCNSVAGAAQQPVEVVFDDRPLSEWVQMLRASDPTIRTSALTTFQQLGSEAGPALPLLLKLASSEELFPRQMALQAIGFIDPDAKEVLAPLVESLRFKDAPLTQIGLLFASGVLARVGLCV